MTVDTATRLLTAHFFRRFIDNDLVSPEGDGHLWPLYLLAFFSCTLGFAALEGQAFQSDWGELALLGGLVALLAGGALCRWAPRRERSIAFDDPRDPAVVRFPLSEST